MIFAGGALSSDARVDVVAALLERKAALESRIAALKAPPRPIEEVVTTKPRRKEKIRAKLELAPLLSPTGAFAFQKDAPLPMFELPAVSGAAYVHRLPLPPKLEHLAKQRRERAALDDMKRDLNITDAELHRFEAELSGGAIVPITKRNKIVVEEEEPFSPPLLMTRDTQEMAEKAIEKALAADRDRDQALAAAKHHSAVFIKKGSRKTVKLQKKWGAIGVWEVIRRIGMSLLEVAFTRWLRNADEASLVPKRTRFRRFQGRQRLVWLWFRFVMDRQLKPAFQKWARLMHMARCKEEARARADVALFSQRAVRRRMARRRVHRLRRAKRKHDRELAATKIQAFVRKRRARLLRLHLALCERQRIAIGRIQAVGRGGLGRWKARRMREARARRFVAFALQCRERQRRAERELHFLRTERAEKKARALLQRAWRGRKARKFALAYRDARRRAKYLGLYRRGLNVIAVIRYMEKRRLQEATRKVLRLKYVYRMQARYRGNQSRLRLRIDTATTVLRDRKRNALAIVLQRQIRMFLAKCRCQRLGNDVHNRNMEEARKWQETQVPRNGRLVYVSTDGTHPTLEVPPRCYTTIDGDFMLDGHIVPNPLKTMSEQEKLAQLAERRCSECDTADASRLCDQCGDKFCAACYAGVHSTGRRRQHTYTIINVAECAECDNDYATLFCRICDEYFCANCFSHLHRGPICSRHQTEPYDPGLRAKAAAAGLPAVP